jgi:hypothetical protein
MEVHHTHHSGHKKKWSEYFLEFFMLFFAVTLGFFAENYREHNIIEHRMKENYEAIIIDLQQDNQKIDSISIEAKNINNLVTLSHVLYKYKTGTFSESELLDSIYNIKLIPSYTTLFVNNTTFKNMQSSGLLSYITDKSLKTNLSYYYEVIFKKLNDNNKLFDEVGISYFDKYLIFGQGVTPRRWLSEIYNQGHYENEFSDPKLYRNFLMQLKSTKAILTSDNFIAATNVYMTRYIVYQGILSVVKTNNNKLIALLENQIRK